MIKIYTTPNCHYCQLAKEFFKSKNLKWEEINLVGNPQAQQEVVQKSEQMSVPVIEIKGKIIIGFNRQAINEALS